MQTKSSVKAGATVESRDTVRTMSQENVRRIYEAHNRGGPDAAEPYWATDIEMLDAPEFPDATRRVGATQVREMLRNYMDVGWNGRFEVQEYLDVDPEVIVVWRMKSVGPSASPYR